MIFRFYFQAVISLICILGILIWSDKGYTLLALFALLPIIMRMEKTTKPDERELQLFYKNRKYNFRWNDFGYCTDTKYFRCSN